MTWTREHDALIARVAEGWMLVDYKVGQHWVKPNGPNEFEAPAYNTDLLACVRAAEAWRKGIPDTRLRQWSVFSAMLGFTDAFIARCHDGERDDEPSIECKSNTPASAIAWALYFACNRTTD